MANYAYFRGEENRLEQKDIPVIKMMKGDDCEKKIKLLKLNVDTGEKKKTGYQLEIILI